MAVNNEVNDLGQPRIRVPGRPRIIPGPEHMAELAEDYFNKTPREEWLITGLVLHLGFAGKSSFYDYEKRPEFSHLIQTLRTIIESSYENDLKSGRYKSVQSPIFALQQFKWKTQAEVNIPGGLGLFETEDPEKRAQRVARELAGQQHDSIDGEPAPDDYLD
jgi:hypothetical protein